MRVYRLDLELHEKVFFASREVDRLFQTEPVVGGYALAYALGFAQAPYHVDSVKKEKPRYQEDLEPLNALGIYVTPATPLGNRPPRLEVERFNALGDSYWYAMSNNVVACDLAVRAGKKARPSNFPQAGRLRVLSRGNRFRAFLFAERETQIPRYVRLGKFLGKTRVDVSATWENPPLDEATGQVCPYFLNPLDLPPEIQVAYFDLLSLPPVPLIRNSELHGPVYRLGEDRLPAKLAYRFPETKKDAPIRKPARRGKKKT